MNFLKVSNLFKSFEDKEVLKNINFSIDKGEIVTLIGSSGCGKSVLMKCILGLLDPTDGEICLKGKPLKYGDKILFEDAGIVFQGGGLFDGISVWENIAFSVLVDKSMKPIEARESAKELIEEVGLDTDILDKSIDELSGGMQRRVSIARALMDNPEFLFMDEPTAGLDIANSLQINKFIVDSARKRHTTMIVIHHDPVGINIMHKRIIALSHGKIVWDGSLKGIEDADKDQLDDFLKEFLESNSYI